LLRGSLFCGSAPIPHAQLIYFIKCFPHWQFESFLEFFFGYKCIIWLYSIQIIFLADIVTRQNKAV
jgi:hypothetical protein